MKLVLIIMMILPLIALADNNENDLSRFKNKKQIPKAIENNVLIALSHYPELEHVPIKFIFKKNINGSVMQAQPVFNSIFKKRTERSYQVNISALLKLTHSAVPIHQLPDNIMIGWIGHELGHIMDYEQRSKLGLVRFGLGYVFSKSYRKQGELVADTYAVNSGLADYILETKRFILDHAELPQAYKDKIERIYLSPDEIVAQVIKLEEKKLKEQKEVLGQ